MIDRAEEVRRRRARSDSAAATRRGAMLAGICDIRMSAEGKGRRGPPHRAARAGRPATMTGFRGRSSAGRASRSQCEGREFDPPRLHHRSRQPGLAPGFLFCPQLAHLSHRRGQICRHDQTSQAAASGHLPGPGSFIGASLQDARGGRVGYPRAGRTVRPPPACWSRPATARQPRPRQTTGAIRRRPRPHRACPVGGAAGGLTHGCLAPASGPRGGWKSEIPN